jgi:hypothetical protein
VRVKVPRGEGTAFAGLLVEAHRIGETALERMIIGVGLLMEQGREAGALGFLELCEAAEMPFRNDNGFKAQNGNKRPGEVHAKHAQLRYY